MVSAAQSHGKPVGLTPDIREKYVTGIRADPTPHVLRMIHRTHQWAASGRYPRGLDHEGLRWLRDASAAEMRRRNPYSAAGCASFPAPPEGSGPDGDVPDGALPQRSWAWLHGDPASPWEAGTWGGDDQRVFDECWSRHGDAGILEDLIGSYGALWPWPAVRRVTARLPECAVAVRRLVADGKLAGGYAYGGELAARALDFALAHGLAAQARSHRRWADPQPLPCPRCGGRFDPAVLEPWAVIQFGPARWCPRCCRSARGGRPGNAGRDQAAAALTRVARVIGAPPPADFAAQPLPLDWPTSRRDALMDALCEAPPAAAIQAAVGSSGWRHVLAGLGLLDSGQRLARGIMCAAADGHPCRSLGERSVDDWLARHAVPHEVEPRWPRHGTLNPHGRLRADWRLADGTYIEYAGMLTDDDYAARIEDKRVLAAESGITLIVLIPEDLRNLDEALTGTLG